MEFDISNKKYPSIKNINYYLQKYDDDCESNNLESLLTYLFDPFFMVTISNNSENSLYKFRFVTAVDMSDELKYDIFKSFYDSMHETKKVTILNNMSFEQFYDEYRNIKHKFRPKVEEKIVSNSRYVLSNYDKTNRDDAKYILNSILSDMLTSETPNFRNVKYYVEECEDLITYYEITIKLLLRYHKYYELNDMVW